MPVSQSSRGAYTVEGRKYPKPWLMAEHFEWVAGRAAEWIARHEAEPRQQKKP